jgi:hypothetical protein
MRAGESGTISGTIIYYCYRNIEERVIVTVTSETHFDSDVGLIAGSLSATEQP